MIRTTTRQFGFLRTAFAVGVAIPILAGSSAFAQQASPSPADQGPIQEGNAGAIGAAGAGSNEDAIGQGQTAETERIIVTGSNIPTAQEVGPNPVLNINRDLINKSGSRTAEDLIKSLPVANGGGVPISNNGTGFTPGATAISLRGLGPEATLVLVDGRRIAPYPVGNGGTLLLLRFALDSGSGHREHRNSEGWRLHHLRCRRRCGCGQHQAAPRLQGRGSFGRIRQYPG